MDDEHRKRLVEDTWDVLEKGSGTRERLKDYTDVELADLIENTWMADLSLFSPQAFLLASVCDRLRRAHLGPVVEDPTEV
jgi:hypothetical protein